MTGPSIAHLLNRELTTYRPATVGDGAGGQTVTYTEVGTIRVQINQPSAAERQVAQQHGANLSHVIHTSYGADVARGDELGGQLPSDVPAGRRLRVIAVVSNSRSTYTRIECEITQPEPESP